MVGGGSRKDDGSVGIKSVNGFNILNELKKKKPSSKNKEGSKSGTGGGVGGGQVKVAREPEVYYVPTPVSKTARWADMTDDDDDDYSNVPNPGGWPGMVPPPSRNKEVPSFEESLSEAYLVEEGDDDVEEEQEREPEVPVLAEPMTKKAPKAPVAPKETERQLSKKELKKKELAELDNILAEFAAKDTSENEETEGGTVEKKTEEKSEETNGNAEKKESAPAESKNAKKKKKKEKAAKDAKDQDHPNGTDNTNGPDESAVTEQAEDDTSSADVKERIKKIASMKKKKSNKEMDAAAKAAAIEAAARSKKLAAAKKKEKNHYNQQPVR